MAKSAVAKSLLYVNARGSGLSSAVAELVRVNPPPDCFVRLELPTRASLTEVLCATQQLYDRWPQCTVLLAAARSSPGAQRPLPDLPAFDRCWVPAGPPSAAQTAFMAGLSSNPELIELSNTATPDPAAAAAAAAAAVVRAEDGSPSPPFSFPQFEHCALGGTFDRLHAGHKLLLSAAALVTRSKLTVGIADGPLLANKTLRELIEPFEERSRRVTQFLHWQHPALQVNVCRLVDPAGPTATDGSVQALVASEETAPGLGSINEQRLANGLEPLQLVKVSLVGSGAGDPTDGSKLSSSELRRQAAAQKL